MKKGARVEQIWVPFTQGCFVQSLVEIGPVVLDKKMEKVCDNDDNVDGQRTIVIRKAHLSLRPRWANETILKHDWLMCVMPEALLLFKN